MNGSPSANTSPKGWFTEGRRAEDVGEVDALLQRVQGGDVHAARADDQLLATAALVDDEA